jgi:ADP-dependent NAD(P)H-hydrate dehydratase / NAD(P)H-hydrate epimerase
VTIGAAKPGLFVAEGPRFAGRVHVADIGLHDPGHVGMRTSGLVLDERTTAGSWPRLTPLAHKGTRGHVVVVAGSRGKTGAAVLAARGALRSGAGLVTVAAVAEVQAAIAALLPEAMTDRVAADADGAIDAKGMGAIDAACAKANAIVAGPGLGTGPGAHAVVDRILSIAVPVVLDADALNVVSRWDRSRRREVFGRRAATGAPAAILTPHPGEMSRLAGIATADIQRERHLHAAKLAEELNCVVVLKGAATVVSDGRRVAYNLSGNAGMATGGMGDVLAGVCGGIVARGHAGDAAGGPFEAACLAVYTHGRAADDLCSGLAAAAASGFLASEVADRMPAVLASRMPR